MTSYKSFNIIVAVNKDNLIGIKQSGEYTLPWPSLEEDMKFLHEKTAGKACIVGKTTYKTLPEKFKRDRKIYVLSSLHDNFPFSYEKPDLNSALEAYANEKYVIGGAILYEEAINHKELDKLYVTEIDQSYPEKNIVEERIYFPHYKYSFEEIESKDYYDKMWGIAYKIKTYIRKQEKKLILHEYPKLIDKKQKVIQQEQKYVDLVSKIINNGVLKKGRNGETKSIFGAQLRYNLALGFPILTIKRVNWRGIVEELLWMLKGKTDVGLLKEKNINIWNKNSSAEYLKKIGLKYDENDIGPGYGFQMRYCGAKYINCKTDYTGQGIDQVKRCLELIKNEPDSRRIIINLWNVQDINEMALPCCHCMYQFTVDSGKLNCHLIQRSWDILLGWNTSTAALMTHIFAQLCGLKVGELVHSITDAHIYATHYKNDLLKEMLKREPRTPPTLIMDTTVKNISDFTMEHFTLKDYYPYPYIKFDMVE